MKLYRAHWRDNGEQMRVIIYDEQTYPVQNLPGVFKMLDDPERGPRTVLLCLMLGTGLSPVPEDIVQLDELIWDVHDVTL